MSTGDNRHHQSNSLTRPVFQGPAEKPGIFIQSTKAGRLAREAGLRPGDQILLCNGVSFTNIEFGDAVYHLKSSRSLELIIRKRAGLELFPSESSGYESSTSSSVGDSAELRDLNHNKIKISVKPPAPPPVSVTPQNTRNHEETKRKLEAEIEAERRKLEAEQERLKKETEALVEERKKFEEEKKLLRNTFSKSSLALAPTKPPSKQEVSSENTKPARAPVSHSNIVKTASTTSDLSQSSTSTGSLATALQLEINRRKQKAAGAPGGQGGQGGKPPAATSPAKSGSAGGRKTPFLTEKNEAHDMLIAEFKKAHKKMFTSSTEASEEEKRDSSETVSPSSSGVKAVPPPPPVRTSTPSTLYTSSNSSEESLASKEVMADKTDTLMTVVNTQTGSARKPGIPTPDYDSTPERSPPLARKMFTKNRSGLTQSKHITPPTVENIQRAKSLTALNKIDGEAGTAGKTGKARAPNPLRSADSLSDLRVSSSPPRPTHPPPSVPTARPGSSRNSQVSSSFQPEFFKRHPELEMPSIESFQTDQTSPSQRPPSTYFDSAAPRSSPAVSLSSSYQSQTEPRRFEFLPRPCDPGRLPTKQNGEEARIASKDYRAVNNGPVGSKTYNIGELPARTLEKLKSNKAENKIKELSEKTARSFGLKKAPAPLPPVLRK